MVLIYTVRRIGYEYIKLIKKAGYELADVEFRLMTRKAYGRYGSCKVTSDGSEAVITINPYLKHEKDVREVIAHELSHAVKDCVGHHHDAVWQRISNEIFAVVGLDAKCTRLNNRELDISEAKVSFKMTEKGVRATKSSHYKDLITVFTESLSPKKLKHYKELDEKGYIEILSIEGEK